MTKHKAGLTQLVNRAAQGDFKSFCEMKAAYESACQDAVFRNPPSLTINFVAPPHQANELPSNSTTETREEEEEEK